MARISSQETILIVDDAPDTLEMIARNLAIKGYKVVTSKSVDDALRTMELMTVDLVITDYKMPKASGLDLVRHIRENYAQAEVFMITGYGSISGAVEALKTGALDYLVKPFTQEELFAAVERALGRLREKTTMNAAGRSRRSTTYGILGESKPMQEVFRAIGKAATTSATVLITGESGTGKELVARAIHYNSPRAAAPFVPVNCGGIPEGLMESELFGHVKGAFTGAVDSRAGFFQTADGGTIFLDEISETCVAMQVKLLRVLQEKEICMVGDSHGRKVNVRIIAATNKNLETLVRKGLFREDLYFRLCVITISVPLLRDRGNDILLLVKDFAARFAHELDRPPLQFSEGALRILKNYSWPGNVRELENVIQRLVVMNDGNLIDAPNLPDLMRSSMTRQINLRRSLVEVEEEYIRSVLASVDGNKSRAAEILGIDRKTLREKLQGCKPE